MHLASHTTRRPCVQCLPSREAVKLTAAPFQQAIPLASGLFDVTIQFTNPAVEERRSDGYSKGLHLQKVLWKRQSASPAGQAPYDSPLWSKHLSSAIRPPTIRLFILKSPAEQAPFLFQFYTSNRGMQPAGKPHTASMLNLRFLSTPPAQASAAAAEISRSGARNSEAGVSVTILAFPFWPVGLGTQA